MNALGPLEKSDSNTHLEDDPQPFKEPLNTTLKFNPKCTFYVVQPGPSFDNRVENNIFKPDIRKWSDSDATTLKDNESTGTIKDIFQNVNFDGAYCSYAQRTYENAKIILGDRKLEIKPRKKFSEMRIGPTAGKTDDQIKQFFLDETGYPGESTEITFPKLWAKRQGGPIEAEDIFLDRWRDDIDTFDDFSAKFIERIKKFAANNLNKTFLILPHKIHLRAMAAEAKGTTSDRVTCAEGSYYKIKIDSNGNFHLKNDLQEGITIS